MNYLGLMSKQEAKELKDLMAIPHNEPIFRMAEAIAYTQRFNPAQTSAVFKEVVHIDVSNYFKNTMSYTVVESTLGQPNGFTLLTSISW